MAAPVRQTIVDQDATFPSRWKTNGAAFLWTVRLNFKSFAAAALTADQDFTGFVGGSVIEGAFLLFNQNWTGGAVATATLQVGTTATPNLYVAATSVFAGATTTAPLPIVGLTLVPGTFLNAANPMGAGTVRVRLTTTVANTNALTAGVADLYIRLRFPFFRAK